LWIPPPARGTLTLITDNTAFGVGGTETLGVQFANTKHALVVQFEGSATSSGSMDLQTLTSPLSGGYAFTLSPERTLTFFRLWPEACSRSVARPWRMVFSTSMMLEL
jgi:hypothetical protein